VANFLRIAVQDGHGAAQTAFQPAVLICEMASESLKYVGKAYALSESIVTTLTSTISARRQQQ